MGTIRKLQNTELVGVDILGDIYPVTSEQAVFDSNNHNITIYNGSINLSYAFPTSGIDSSEKYSLQQAVITANTMLPEDKKVKGFVIQFIPQYEESLKSYVYNSSGLFNDPKSWIPINPVESTLPALDYNSLFESQQMSTSLALTSILNRISLFDNIIRDAEILQSGTSDYTEIVYVEGYQTFAAKYQDKYYGSWNAKDDYDFVNYYNTGNKACSKIFRQSNGSLWYFNGEQLVNLYESYSTNAEWSGIVVDDGNIVNMSVPQQEASKIIYIQSKNTFAYNTGIDTYASNWSNRELFQKNQYIQNNTFNPQFTVNYFKGQDGSIWKASSPSTLIQLNNSAPIDGSLYGLKDGQWTKIQQIDVDSSLNDQSQNPISNKAVTLALQDLDKFYILPGDITKMGDSFETSILGTSEDLEEAMKKNKTILSKGISLLYSYESESRQCSIVAIYSSIDTEVFMYKEFWKLDLSNSTKITYNKFKFTGESIVQ